jgi:hypothetical protein
MRRHPEISTNPLPVNTVQKRLEGARVDKRNSAIIFISSILKDRNRDEDRNVREMRLK